MENRKSTTTEHEKGDYLASLLQGDSVPLEAAAKRWYEEAWLKKSEIFANQNYITAKESGQNKAKKIVESLTEFINATDEKELNTLLTLPKDETAKQEDYTLTSFQKTIKNLQSLANGNPLRLDPHDVVGNLSNMLVLIKKNDPNNETIIESDELLFSILEKMPDSMDIFYGELERLMKDVLQTTQVPLVTENDYKICLDAVNNWDPSPGSTAKSQCAHVQIVLLNKILPSIKQQQLLAYKNHINEQLSSLQDELPTIRLKYPNKADAMDKYLTTMKQHVETYLNEKYPKVEEFKIQSKNAFKNTAKELKNFTNIKNKIGKLTVYILSFGIVAGIDKLVEAKTGFSIFSVNSSTAQSLKGLQKAIHESLKPPQSRP